MSLETNAVDEVSYQWNSEVPDVTILETSVALRDANHLNIVLAVDTLFTRKVTLPLLKKAPFCNLSLREISQVRECVYKAGVYSTPLLNPAVIEAECLLELQYITKLHMKHSATLHPSCFRPIVLMSSVAPDTVVHSLFHWLSENHRVLSPIVPFIADAFVSLGNTLSMNINSDTPLFPDAFYMILSSNPRKCSVPQPVLHHLCVMLLTHSSNVNIIRIDQCLRFVVLPLIKEQRYSIACELLRRMDTVTIRPNKNANPGLIMHTICELIMLTCSLFTVDNLKNRNTLKDSSTTEDVQNAVTVVELCRRYVSQHIMRSMIEKVGKHMSSSLIIRLVHCVVPSDIYSAKRDSELLQSLHDICGGTEPTLTSYERVLTLSVLTPDFSVKLSLRHQYHNVKWNTEPVKSGLWIAALARQAFIFSDHELSVLFSCRLPFLLEVLRTNLPDQNQPIPGVLDATLLGCQLGLQASIATQYVPMRHICQRMGENVALRICRAICSAITAKSESFPEPSVCKCNFIKAATSVLLKYLTGQFEKDDPDWPGRSLCADVVTVALLELLRKFGTEARSVISEDIKVKVINLRDLISQFNGGHADATRVRHAALSALQSKSV